MNETTVGLVLAAGAASRFGGGKLLATARRPADPPARPRRAWPRPGSTTSSSSWATTPPRSKARSPGATNGASSTPTRAWAVELAPGRVRGGAGDGRGRARGPRRPAARLRRGRSGAARRRRPTRPAGRRCRPTRRARPQPGPAPARGVRPRRRGGRRSRARADAGGAPGAGRRGRRSPAANPDVDTRDDLAPRHRGGVGRARPGEPRAGRAHPRGPRRGGLLRAGQLAVPGRPDPRRRSRPGGAARARPAGRHVARRRRGRRSLRAADRPRARPVRRFGHRPRRVARRCSRACSRSPRTTPSRTSGPSRRDGRPADPSEGGVYEADVALIAHVGYDIEAIGPFIDALEAAAGRICVAVLMERVPASAADPFWPPVHGEARVGAAGPARLPRAARGARSPAQGRPWSASSARRFETRDVLEAFIRRQLWIDPAGPKEARFRAALDELTVQDGDGWTIEGRGQSDVGVVTWTPGPPIAR